jgi:hypothetical protein
MYGALCTWSDVWAAFQFRAIRCRWGGPLGAADFRNRPQDVWQAGKVDDNAEGLAKATKACVAAAAPTPQLPANRKHRDFLSRLSVEAVPKAAAKVRLITVLAFCDPPPAWVKECPHGRQAGNAQETIYRCE